MTTQKTPKKKTAPFITGALFLILLALGFWQVHRLVWKTALLTKIEAQMAQPSASLFHTMDKEAVKDWEYRRVKLTGRVIAGPAFFLKPRTQGGKNGYHRIVPFRQTTGQIVFVNLGWVPEALPQKIEIKGRQRLEGFVTLPVKGAFTPENNPAKNDWYWADVPAMAKAAGLAGVMPVVVSVMPLRPDIPNNHLQYAVFWFGMAFVLLAVYIIWRRNQRNI